jgi:V8-like Glu-specific endopeptidase
MWHRRTPGLLVAVLLAAGLGAGACTAGTAQPAAPAATPTPDGLGRTVQGEDFRHVGALFHSGSDHFCTGSLIAGPADDLIVTAAHCVGAGSGSGQFSDITFAPGYRQGAAPYGFWKTGRITVDPRWTASSDPDLDVAFIQVQPRDGKRIADLFAGNRIAFDHAAAGPVRVTGYPDGKDDPITCLGVIQARSATQMRVACTGYGDGTSGSPWAVDYDRSTGIGTVIGVIGGYEAGGDTDDVSYSPYFGADVKALWDQATRA